MKKIAMLLLGLLLCFTMVFAGTKALEFAWQQPGSLTDLAGWNLYMSETAGAPGTKVLTIAYAGVPNTEYVGTKDLISPDGLTKVYYFTLTATDTSGNESGKSNEVMARIDFEAPLTPFGLRVTIRTP